jgi:hypothetical protein
MTTNDASQTTGDAAGTATTGDDATQTTTTTQTGTDAATGADAGADGGSVLGAGDTGGETSKDANADATGDTGTEGDAAEADTVPEDGVYKLALPEGVEIDEAALAVAAPVFKELGLTNGQATKIAEVFANLRQAEGEQQAEAWVARNRDWVATAKADKTYANVGFDAAAKVANAAVRAFGDDDLVTVLNETGLGNHPALIRAFYKAGAAMANDTTERGTNAGAAAVPMEERMYGSTTPTKRRA